MMMLLSAIALGLLSLSSIQLRTSSREAALQTARANARLSIAMAMGEIQQQLGPDCRISAAASILDQNAATPTSEQVSNSRYLGVWDSWDTWLSDRKELTGGGSMSIQESYTPGRSDKLFRRWLVSHPDPLVPSKKETAGIGAGGIPTITVVGEGSVGNTPEGRVDVPLVPLKQGNPGAYAWWVADESQKARIDLQDRSKGGDFQLAQGQSSASGRPKIEHVGSLAQLNTGSENLKKLLDQPTLYASMGKGANSEEPRPYHDLSGYSLGLLTDVRAGGMKGDLNLLFESDSVPAAFDKTKLFGDRSFDAPIRPMLGELAKITPQNPYVAPMSWRQLREYYRLYRSFGTADTIGRYVQWNGGSPSTRRFLMGRKEHEHILTMPDTAGYARQPVLLRQTWILATRAQPSAAAGGYTYYLVGVPVFHLWNPYNLPMRLDSREMAVVGGIDLAANLKYCLYNGSTKIGERSLSLNNEMGGLGYGLYQVQPIETGGGEIVFQPGQVRVFTVDSQVPKPVGGAAPKLFDAAPGYRPLADTSAVRGLQLELANFTPAGATSPAPPPAPGALSMALRFDDTARINDNYYWGNSSKAMTVGLYQLNAGRYGAFDEGGNKLVGLGHEGTVYGACSIDWLAASEGQSWIIPDSASSRAEWNLGTTKPQPVAIISVVAKGAEAFTFDTGGSGYAGDFRNRTWLHAPPTQLSNYLMNPTALSRAASAYQLHFKAVNGDQEVAQYIQVDGKSGYYGGGFTPAGGQTHVPVSELPTSAVTNLAGFAGMRIDHARALVMQHNDSASSKPGGSPYPMYNLKHVAHAGGAFGPGIGNSYAHSMIPGDKVYSNISMGVDQGNNPSNYQATNLPAFNDHWDQLFLANEGLWDSYFLSSLTPESSRGSIGKSLQAVASGFFKGGSSLSNRNLVPYNDTRKPEEITTLVTGSDGWKHSGSHLQIEGAFNVNSTSIDAWKALLLSLRARQVPWLDANSLATGSVDQDKVVLSRFRLANGKDEGNGPEDEMSWRGVRALDDEQVDRLATEIVRQVKLRGPFLNLSEFVNRRLSTDRLGVAGALQAAIDWDEFEAGYDGTGSNSSASINRSFKQGDDMITQPPATYPNPLAARGSRYAGAPGYVMQSDLLQGLASSLTVRGDTFRIRGFGEARDDQGRVTARAWCEAVVQRMPEYLDPANDPEVPARLGDGSANPALKELNRRFGRRLDIVAFRWLNPKEV